MAEKYTAIKTDSDLACERTDLAQERTMLANQRTFSAWVRTGLTASAVGLGVAKLIRTPHWSHVTLIVGVIFILSSSFIYVIAIWRYYVIYRDVRGLGFKTVILWPYAILSAILLISSVMLLLLLW